MRSCVFQPFFPSCSFLTTFTGLESLAYRFNNEKPRNKCGFFCLQTLASAFISLGTQGNTSPADLEAQSLLEITGLEALAQLAYSPSNLLFSNRPGGSHIHPTEKDGEMEEQVEAIVSPNRAPREPCPAVLPGWPISKWVPCI